ncbi:hypothetical protein [Trichlorobacter sp.]|uniref:hypothetical protein n=1 Tax=Trichlorobacter sp. TaxID=2911007 RepID=UPI002A366D75|nr:hypothetical protein [Trichlorobacter sp.]MDY0383110.1 hypothetical protein [Trichlorobacter sp.]
MELNPITSTAALAGAQSYQQPTPAAQQAQADQAASAAAIKAAPARQVSDQVQTSSVALKNLDTVKAIEQMHTKMNQLISGVRETNEQLAKAAEQVSAMQANLNAIIKNYPPFNLDSKDRQDLLMSYASIRQELIKMMVPPPPPPIYEQVQHLWNTTVGQNGQMLASAVPALETSSPDSMVQSAASQLAATTDNLGALSSGVTQALIAP